MHIAKLQTVTLFRPIRSLQCRSTEEDLIGRNSVTLCSFAIIICISLFHVESTLKYQLNVKYCFIDK